MTNVEYRPLVTVAISCFNYQEFVGEAIQSVYSQTYPNIQLIVVNDGSTDDSDGVIRGLLKLYNFEYISHENIGLIKSINKAVTKTKGEFFIHLGADDIMLDNYVEELVGAALKNPDVSIFYTDLVNLDTGKIVVRPPEFDEELLKHYNFIHGTSMVRARLMKEIDYDQNLKGLGLEDWDFFLSAVLKGEKAKYVATTHLRYRRHQTLRSRSQLRRSDARGLKAIKYIYDKNIEKYPDKMQHFLWLKDNMHEAIKYLDIYTKQNAENEEKIRVLESDITKLERDLVAVMNSRAVRIASFIKKHMFFRRNSNSRDIPDEKI